MNHYIKKTILLLLLQVITVSAIWAETAPPVNPHAGAYWDSVLVNPHVRATFCPPPVVIVGNDLTGAEVINSCPGVEVQFCVEKTLYATGNSTFRWKRNDVFVDNVDTPENTCRTFTLTENDTLISVVITTEGECVYHVEYGNRLNISEDIKPQVKITYTPVEDICENTQQVTFTAEPVNGGTSPSFQWFLNGQMRGFGQAFTTLLSAGDSISCEMQVSAESLCGEKIAIDGLKPNVNKKTTPSVTIKVEPDYNVCQGDELTFTAVGTTGNHQWKRFRDGMWTNMAATGKANDTLKLSDIRNEDKFCVLLVPTETCLSSFFASDTIEGINVIPKVTPRISIAADCNPVSPGRTLTFNSTIINSSIHDTYQWYVNGNPVEGVEGIGASYTSDILVAGDKVTCMLTSGVTCVTDREVISNEVTIENQSLSVPGKFAYQYNEVWIPEVTGAANALTGTNVPDATSYGWTITPIMGTPSSGLLFNDSNTEETTTATYSATLKVNSKSGTYMYGKYMIEVAAQHECFNSTTYTDTITVGCGMNIFVAAKDTVDWLACQCWNLGASQQPLDAQKAYTSPAGTGVTNAVVYGDLYQWGRKTDGYEKRNSALSPTNNNSYEGGDRSNTPPSGKFVKQMNRPYDWRLTQNNSLWQAAKTANDPCPAGWRVPTMDEWCNSFSPESQNNWVWNDADNTKGYTITPEGSKAGHTLFLPAAGGRAADNGTLGFASEYGLYWSTTPYDTPRAKYSNYLNFQSDHISRGYNGYRAVGMSVRCVQEK